MLEPQTPEHHLLDTGFAQLSSESVGPFSESAGVVFCPFSGSTALFAEPCFAQDSFLRQIGNDRAGHVKKSEVFTQCSEAFAASAPLGVPTNPSIGMVDSLSNLKHPTLAVLSSWHKQTVKKLAPSALAAFFSYFPAEGHGAESAHALSDAGPAVRSFRSSARLTVSGSGTYRMPATPATKGRSTTFQGFKGGPATERSFPWGLYIGTATD